MGANMYIWTGINVDNALRKVKEKAQAIYNTLPFSERLFTMPMHVSLKMSFEVPDEEAQMVIAALQRLFATQPSFGMQVIGLEQYDNIAWIRIVRSAKLDKLHDDILALLQTQFGVQPHEYDLDYTYHVTLFMDDDAEVVKCAAEQISTTPLPKLLTVDTFAIGTSEDGKIGTWTVKNVK